MASLCRVYARSCTVYLQGINNRSTCSSSSNTSDLLVFGINTSNEMPSSHPALFCYTGNPKIALYKKALVKVKCTSANSDIQRWMSNTWDQCSLCEHGRRNARGEGGGGGGGRNIDTIH